MTFTEPQVAAVGLTEARGARGGARRRGLRDRHAAPTPAARSTAAARPARPGWSSTSGGEVVVGATFTGADVQDFLHAATIAVVGEVPLDALWHAIPSFPTRSEVWLQFLEAWPAAQRERMAA